MPTLLLLAFHAPGLRAFTFITEAPLYFGELAIPSNLQISSMTLTRKGRVSSTGKIFVIEHGAPGEYTLSGLIPFTSVSLSVTLPVESVTPFGGTQQLTLTAVDVPTSLNVNNAGEVSFQIGGTIQTSGTGGLYQGSDDYQFYIPLEITL